MPMPRFSGAMNSRRPVALTFQLAWHDLEGSGPDGVVIYGRATATDGWAAVPTTFDVTYNGEAIFPIDGSTHFGFTGRATISRSAFGVSHAPDVISDEIDLTIDVRFVRAASTEEST